MGTRCKVILLGLFTILLAGFAEALISNYNTEVIAGYSFNNSGLGDVKYNHSITDSGTVPYYDINTTLNYSRKFDTNTDRLILQDMYSLGTQERGLSIWLNATDWTPADTGWIYYSDSAAGGTTSLNHGTTEIAYNVRDGGAYNTIKHVPGWSDGTWHNIIVTWKPGNQTMYLDGVYVNSSTAVNNITYRNDGYALPYSLGGRNGVESFIGIMDEVIFFDHFVDDNEALEIYQQYDTWYRTVTPPGDSVNILDPANNTHLNSDNLTVDFNTTISSSTCDFNLNGTYNASKSYDGSGNDTFTLAVNEAIYSVMINCSNATASESSGTYTYYIDRTEPPITDNSGLNDTDVTSETSILNVTVGPDYLYMVHVNASCSDGTNIYSQNYSEDGSYQTVVLNDTINNSLCPNGDYITVFVQAADTHTAKEIKYIPHTIDQSNKKIMFYQGVSIYPADKSSFGTVSTTKLLDRYTFKFKRTKSAGNFDDFYLEGDNVDQIFEGNYADVGHFVEWYGFGGVSHWIDFNTDQKYPVSILKLGNDKYRVRIDCSKDGCSKDYNFKSLGGLNENNVTITYYFDGSNITFTETYDNTTVENADITLYGNVTFNTLRYSALNSITLTWNNTNYTSYVVDEYNITLSQNQTYFSANLTTPDLSASANITHYWILNFTEVGGSDRIYTTTPQNQTIYIIGIDNCTTYTTRAINFSLRDDQTEALVTGRIDGYFLINMSGQASQTEYNLSWGEASQYGLCFLPDWGVLGVTAQLEYYSGTEYEAKTYYITDSILDNVTDVINLYLTNQSTDVTFTVLDQDDNAISNAYIYVKIYDVGTNSYKTSEIVRTDSNGQAVAKIILYTEWYQFVIVYQGEEVFNSEPTKIISTTNTFRIDLVADYYDDYTESQNVYGTVSYSNTTQNFAFTFTETTGTPVYGCLKVTKQTPYLTTDVGTSCTTTSSGTILINIAAFYDNATFIGTGYVTIDGTNYIIDTHSETFGGQWRSWGLGGLFATFLVTLTLIMIGLARGNPALSILGLVIGIVSSVMMGIFYLSWGALISFVILGGLVLYKLRNR